MIFFHRKQSKRNSPKVQRNYPIQCVQSQMWFQRQLFQLVLHRRQVLPRKLLQVDLAILNWMWFSHFFMVTLNSPPCIDRLVLFWMYRIQRLSFRLPGMRNTTPSTALAGSRKGCEGGSQSANGWVYLVLSLSVWKKWNDTEMSWTAETLVTH